MIRELQVTALDLSQPATIWDVRDAASHAEGHLRGAVSQPLETLTAALLATVPAGQPIYVLCGGGTKAGRACALLENLDPSREYVELKGGTRAAKAAGLVEEGNQ